MQELMDEIQNRIRAEKLLFSDDKEYSAEEVKFISKVCVDNIRQEVCYMGLFCEYLPKLRRMYLNHPEEKFANEIYGLGVEVGKWLSKSDEEQMLDEQGSYFLYKEFLGLPKDETYYDFIKNRVMDVKQVKEILNSGYAYEFYSHNINFVITNNFLLIHYPELYNMEDLSQLKNIAYDVDKTRFAEKKEYNNFKKASNAMKSRLRHYERNNRVKIKNK